MSDIVEHLKTMLAFWDIIRSSDFLMGRRVRSFEKKLSRVLGGLPVASVASGTDGLILSLKALGIGPGDEVIVPAVSFFSTAASVAWVNAMPVFVDVDPATFHCDPVQLESAVTPKTKAVMVAHLNGGMADMEPIVAIARRHHIFIIEDAAQAIGALYKGHPAGHYGDVAVFSFNPSKILATYGDGGAVASRDVSLIEKISRMRMYGSRLQDLSARHDMLGVASRLGPFQAAVLDIGIDVLEKRIQARRKIFFQLVAGLADVSTVVVPAARMQEDHFVTGYRFPLLVPKRDALLSRLRRAGIDARTHYQVPLPRFQAFSSLPSFSKEFPGAERVAREVVVLPTDQMLTDGDVQKIISLCGETAN